jgi:hypothetical protein
MHATYSFANAPHDAHPLQIRLEPIRYEILVYVIKSLRQALGGIHDGKVEDRHLVATREQYMVFHRELPATRDFSNQSFLVPPISTTATITSHNQDLPRLHPQLHCDPGNLSLGAANRVHARRQDGV